MARSAPSAGSNWRVQLIALLVVSVACARVRSQSLGTVYVTEQDYSSEHQNGNIQGLYCDQPGNHNPYPACENNYWVAYSVSLNPPMSQALCGKCIQVCICSIKSFVLRVFNSSISGVVNVISLVTHYWIRARRCMTCIGKSTVTTQDCGTRPRSWSNIDEDSWV